MKFVPAVDALPQLACNILATAYKYYFPVQYRSKKKGLQYEPGKGILWKSKNIFQAENADFTQPGAHHLEHHCT